MCVFRSQDMRGWITRRTCMSHTHKSDCWWLLYVFFSCWQLLLPSWMTREDSWTSRSRQKQKATELQYILKKTGPRKTPEITIMIYGFSPLFLHDWFQNSTRRHKLREGGEELTWFDESEKAIIIWAGIKRPSSHEGIIHHNWWFAWPDPGMKTTMRGESDVNTCSTRYAQPHLPFLLSAEMFHNPHLRHERS